MPYTTGILLFDEAEELDFTGPLEVFGMARQDGDRVVTIAERPDPVRANLGLRVVPDHTLADAPPLDVLVVPGGMGTRREVENPVAVLDPNPRDELVLHRGEARCEPLVRSEAPDVAHLGSILRAWETSSARPRGAG